MLAASLGDASGTGRWANLSTGVVARSAYGTASGLLEEIGHMMIQTGKTIWPALRPRYPCGGELVSQFLFALRLCWFPLLISTVAINYAAPGLQAANFLRRRWAQAVLSRGGCGRRRSAIGTLRA